MQFEWDEAKRRANAAKHGVDFARALELFDGRPIATFPSPFPDEERQLTVGILDGRFHTIVWTVRGGAIRLISATRARDGEERAYRAVHGG